MRSRHEMPFGASLAAGGGVDFRLWGPAAQKAEVAIGSRALDRSLIGVHQSGFREEAGKLFNLMMKAAIRLPFEDWQRSAEGLQGEGRAVEILAVDQALTALAGLNERLSRLVELLYFAGLTEEEAGRVLGISDRTVRRDWRKARAFLFHTLGQAGSVPADAVT